MDANQIYFSLLFYECEQFGMKIKHAIIHYYAFVLLYMPPRAPIRTDNLVLVFLKNTLSSNDAMQISLLTFDIICKKRHTL